MKKHILAAALMLSLAGYATADTAGIAAAGAASTFSDAQKQQIGEVAADYLRAHPEILIEMSQKLQAQSQEKQMTAAAGAALENQDALLNDPTSPVLHPKGDVAVIQFFDYQCIYCAKVAPTVEQFIRQNPDVRFIYKEWPIFGSRWPASVQAAKVGLSVYKDGGADAYHRYHAALYATGHNEGKLLDEDIRQAAVKAGVTATPKEEVEAMGAALEKNNALAKRLGIQGTPAFFVMPVKGATAENISVIPGATDLQALQAAVEKARGAGG
ncbi:MULTISPECIES: DsbA family protein [Mixta]|uniref:DsbA family protein n=1 Tax=Mixta hanseatica TaxID=2872648 RepID=A0ABY4RDI8_9GAMM|nr:MULTISPECIES: DsbA family protein [Mixta]MDU3818610.1 DsbA family protein [Pantoea sp.]MDU5189491.1 DsbA family protein [Mixta calida]UQY46260.1 DsbA family protein [Mixta hanseatica]